MLYQRARQWAVSLIFPKPGSLQGDLQFPLPEPGKGRKETVLKPFFPFHHLVLQQKWCVKGIRSQLLLWPEGSARIVQPDYRNSLLGTTVLFVSTFLHSLTLFQ